MLPRLLLACLVCAPALAQTPPNVVLILADDLGYGDLGPYDHDDDPATPPVTNTPVLDALATQGTRLSDYYSVSPVCTPTRVSIQTGRHNARVGVTGVFHPWSWSGMPQSEITLADLLRARGYRTGIVGKWHLGHVPGFLPLDRGYDRFYGVPYSNDMTPFYVMSDAAVVDPSPDQAQLHQSFVAEALQFISGAAAQGQPFFLYMPLVLPHVPVYVHPTFDGATGRGLYADAVFEIDEGVGRILARLAQLGIDSNTLVLFTSDNGPWKGTQPPATVHPEPWRWVGGSAGPLRGGKATAFEGGVRVPLLARWPGRIATGLVANTIVDSSDLFTTICAAAGAPLPADRVIDGRDLLPLLSGAGSPPDRPLFVYSLYHFGVPQYGTRELWAMRNGRWKLHFDGLATPLELYDLETDPGETTPLVLPAVVGWMQDQARNFECSLDAPPVVVPPSKDLAGRKPTQASSSLDCDGSARAVDGDAGTLWRSAKGGTEWIQVDLGAEARVLQVSLQWGPSFAARYRVRVSSDGLQWSNAAIMHAGAGGTETLSFDRVARYVRVRMEKPSLGRFYSLRELRVRGMFLDPGMSGN